MSEKIIGGKKPLSSKKRPGLDSKNADAFGNKLSLPVEVLKELADQNLVPRFINAKQLQDMGGYHAKGWRPYKRKDSEKGSDTMGTSSFLSGSDPSGFIRRGDAILAVKTESEVAEHRDWLEARAGRHKNFKKQKANELRAYAKENGLKTTIDDSDEFDDEGETE